MKCPICDREMKHDSDTLDGWCLREETYTCPKGHYCYDYSYGYTRVFVNNYEVLSYGYSDERGRKLDEFMTKWYIKLLRFVERIKR